MRTRSCRNHAGHQAVGAQGEAKYAQGKGQRPRIGVTAARGRNSPPRRQAGRCHRGADGSPNRLTNYAIELEMYDQDEKDTYRGSVLVGTWNVEGLTDLKLHQDG